jgi:hypothetical protein
MQLRQKIIFCKTKLKGFAGKCTSQATNQIFVIYFKKSDALNIQHENEVTLSYLKCNTTVANTFTQHLMNFEENK